VRACPRAVAIGAFAPVAAAYDVYVVNSGNESVSVIDSRTQEVVGAAIPASREASE
jgi:YVTN family beta-propeller protein